MKSLCAGVSATFSFYLFWFGFIWFLSYFRVVLKCICFYLLLCFCYFLYRCFCFLKRWFSFLWNSSGQKAMTEQHQQQHSTITLLSNEEGDHRTFQWSWYNDYGSCTPYSEEVSQVLMQAYLCNPHSCTLIQVDNKTYRVDFDNMTQTNVATGFQRPIQYEEEKHKVVKSRARNDRAVCHQGLSESLESFPSWWKPHSTTVKVFRVQSGTQEWSHVKRKFRATITDAYIKRIWRVQNTWLWKRYVHHKKMMEEKNRGAVNEMELFHGTGETDPREIYDSEEGFDMRFSAQGMWGQANYFAVKASYSDKYAHTNTSGQKEIFLANVLTGDTYRCSSDSSLRMPPLKPSTGGVQLHQVRYDTVTGFTGGCQVYMTYDNQKAYPTYLILYWRH